MFFISQNRNSYVEVDRMKILRTKLELIYIGKKYMGWLSTWWFSKVVEDTKKSETSWWECGKTETTGHFLYIHSHKIEKKKNGEEERGKKDIL